MSRDSCGSMSMSKHGVVPCPPHTYMPAPPIGGQVSSSETVEASTNRGRGGKDPLLNKMADQQISTRDFMKVCTHTHTHIHTHAHTHTHTFLPSFSCVHSTSLNEGGVIQARKVYMSPLVPLGTETLVIGKSLDFE